MTTRYRACMFFGVLGPVAVWTADGQPVPVPGLKVRALLAVLLVHEGRPVPAARLIDALWGEHLPGDPAGTLSGKVTQLRGALERAEPGGRRLVGSPPPGYRLRIDAAAVDANTADASAMDAAAVDANRFRRLTALAQETADPRARAGLLSDALALWRGPAFADFADEPFARIAAARLTEERLAAIEDHADARLALGEHTKPAAELAELLAAHPTRERLRAAHMRALYRSGRPSEALESYEELRAHLADELGLDPGPDLVALHRAVLARDPALEAPVRPPAVRPPTNLPAAISELIGRDEAVAAIRARLGTDRLVTLTGPGGVGKTRLALETAGGLVGDLANGLANGLASGLASGLADGGDGGDDFADGVWLAELGALEPGSAGRPADVVMAALDIRDLTGAKEPSADRLADALRAKRTLLVLDNCEHVIGQAAELAGRLLRGCPGLRVLATSREPLGLPGEVVWAVPPLDVPDIDPAADAADAAAAAELARSPAVRLFAARAAAAAPGWALTADVAPAVAVLCRRLDGIPLALELAATRVRALGVDELVARLDDRFRLLATGRRDAPARQRTLTAMIDWSWDLLTEPDRVVLRRLAVHADGCTLEAAEQVCAEPGGVDRADVAGRLSRLVDRSLVTVAHGPGGPRYRLLESVAAYCGDRLAAAGEAERVRDRHGRYYTELAVRAEERLYGHDQRRWLRRLDSETANLRCALDTAIRRGAAGRALRLVGALTWYWFLRGRLTEARRSLRTALTVQGGSPTATRARAAAWQAGIEVLLGEPDPAAERVCEQVAEPVARARAEWFLAYAETDLGDVPAVDERLERALTGFRDGGDQWGTAAVLSTRAKLGYLRADLKALERDGERSAELFRELGDRWGLLQATAWLGGLAEMVGDRLRATRLHREGLRMAEELGLWTEVSVRLAWLGWIAMQQCDYSRARDLSGQALRLAAEQGFRVGETFAEMGVAFAARRQGDLDLAERHLNSLLRAAGPDEEGRAPPLYLPLVLTELGLLAERRGQAAEARRLHLRSLRASRTLGGPRGVAMALEGLAGAVGLAGDHETAARLLGAADSARRAASVPAAPSERTEIGRITTATRAALGEAAFDVAYQDGTARTPDDVAATGLLAEGTA